MSELCWASMADIGRMIATEQVSPVDVVRAHLDRIAAHDGKLRAFITVCADAALESARAAEAELMAGRPVGPLHGRTDRLELGVGPGEPAESRGAPERLDAYFHAREHTTRM